jgi:hypothetical protein
MARDVIPGGLSQTELDRPDCRKSSRKSGLLLNPDFAETKLWPTFREQPPSIQPQLPPASSMREFVHRAPRASDAK